MNSIGVAKAYDRWAPIYDLVFGAVFRQGRSVAIDAAERVGGRILEVGVGTGISLPRYRRSSRITGVDLSDAMLDKARGRVARLGLTNVEAIEIGDAERLAYPDHAFDVVVAQYVVSAVPHPLRALDECARVCRPGGEIVITTRVSADGGLRGAIERGLMPVTSRLGFRTEFPFSLYSDWVASRPDVTLLEARPIAPFGHFSLVRFGRTAGGKGQDQ
ncbi:methyltransferase domain-containing protein [Sphingomonas sp. S-NIH.Pt15_0812]|jgi:phosphatidylethanolamine/phosphatidyl-N-methylethanolamine N-methyltransferase|uniref:class I SAM-dependent methyltransferase n=1 Tax=Sphingomonas sp. S-NIH.Pt15_0812 TaxID=1920129 RepID=UPI000F7F7228|nr:methyltransferase domain-containing protein [Sphingomonas sp. S-NIH.Pt15_0812]RSU54038.1 SAM-dependent methyltransferase [Sphingomonas sp. S-NIH.Pt15_0812]